jgi:bacteriorhodopsin
VISASPAPWTATLTQPEYLLTQYFIVVAMLGLFAGFLRTWTTRGEVGSRYRPAVVARLAVTGIATISYVLVFVNFRTGYDHTPAGWVPNAGAIDVMATRFMDWSITVPLLTVELISVCMLAGRIARRTQYAAMAGAFLMIFSGYLGAFVVGGGADATQSLLWGGISAVFWIATNIILIRSVRASLASLTPESAELLKRATWLLLSGWVVYPIVYLVQVFTFGGGWSTAIQIALCVADVAVKIGFGGLIHRVAKLRTAEDVRAGNDVHPESIWISLEKLSDAGLPPEVYLADGAAAHRRRSRPTSATAFAADPESALEE